MLVCGRRTLANCGKLLRRQEAVGAGIIRLEPTIRLVVFTQGKRPRDTPAASMRIFQRRARLIHDPAHKVSAPRLLGALAELGASGLCLKFSLC